MDTQDVSSDEDSGLHVRRDTTSVGQIPSAVTIQGESTTSLTRDDERGDNPENEENLEARMQLSDEPTPSQTAGLPAPPRSGDHSGAGMHEHGAAIPVRPDYHFGAWYTRHLMHSPTPISVWDFMALRAMHAEHDAAPVPQIQEAWVHNHGVGDYDVVDDDMSTSQIATQPIHIHPVLQSAEQMLSAGPLQNRVYSQIAAAVILRRYLGHVEMADLLKDYMLRGPRRSDAQVYLDIAEEELSHETWRPLEWKQSESLMMIGRAVETIGEDGEERDELIGLFRIVLEGDLDGARLE